MIAPENLEVANKYLELNSIPDVASALNMPKTAISEILEKPEVKRYIDAVYLDTGYRNRNKLAELLDTIIDAKLEECQETEMYTDKDIVDLLNIAHKMRMDELKLLGSSIKTQNNIQINDSSFGGGNYGELMKKLLKE